MSRRELHMGYGIVASALRKAGMDREWPSTISEDAQKRLTSSIEIA